MTRPETIAAVEAAVRARGGDTLRRESTFTCPDGSHHANGDAEKSARYNSEKKVWHCPVGNVGGGYMDLARRLQIDLNDLRDGAHPPDLEDFARDRSLPIVVLREFS